MRYSPATFPGWIRGIFCRYRFTGFPQQILKVTFLVVLVTVCSTTVIHGQSEDSTQTERQPPEQVERESTDPANRTPYNMDVPESNISRYELRDYGSSTRFYRQLKYRSLEDFLMSEPEGYERYGAEWERKINEQLHRILAATFREESDLVKLLKRLKPFLQLGFFEPYEVPISRVHHPDKVDVEEP